MENNDSKINTSSFLLEKIRSGEITTRSKNYFRLRIFALILTISATFIVSILFCSFILFNLRAGGQLSLIGFGEHGTSLFFRLFPWKFFLINVVLIILSGLLIRSFRFGYKVPALYLGMTFIMIMTLVGITIDQTTNLSPTILRSAREHRIPLFQSWYQNAVRPPYYLEGIYRGIVTSVGIDSFEIRIEECCVPPNIYKVVPPPLFPLSQIETGTFVLVEGKLSENTISATEIGMTQVPFSE